ncbi:hypothetical protein DPMN_063346 [Dreissena polymorpha]|uniref:Uncharacterized protein n=1 Tax=Dreissena polymorpha TaxID=45954 RepID=A0A9D4CAC4_DREPO|nr:hypothetical protein DPMN_063346 [Dreissena polymorpha]
MIQKSSANKVFCWHLRSIHQWEVISILSHRPSSFFNDLSDGLPLTCTNLYRVVSVDKSKPSQLSSLDNYGNNELSVEDQRAF